MKYLFLLMILTACSNKTNCKLNSCIVMNGKGYKVKETFNNPNSVLLEQYPDALTRIVLPLNACQNEYLTSEVSCDALNGLIK